MNKAISNTLKNIIIKDNRYKDFTFLDVPKAFNDMFSDIKIPRVQIHSTKLCGNKHFQYITGICGAFAWEDNKITPLDHDTYDDRTPVLGYEWFTGRTGDICLDILVGED